MATVSFTIATTSISKSWRGDKGPSGCHRGGPGWGVPRVKTQTCIMHTRITYISHVSHTCVHTRGMTLPGDTQGIVCLSWGHAAVSGCLPTPVLAKYRSSHPSAFDGVSQEPHHIVPFCAGGLEALGPIQEDALG